jgi:hypothetical protein
VSVRALETNIQILRGILGSQIDRLTARMIELPSSHEPFLELLKLTITDQRSLPSPATTPSANVKELRRELLRAAVAAARYAGQLNVTTRHVARDVEESGRILQVDGEPLAPIFNDILVDTARAFNGYLKHIDGYTPDEMREAGVQKQVQLLQHNFPAVGTTL